jgi:DNA-directed RNA polymerase specialized sigma24 family protein
MSRPATLESLIRLPFSDEERGSLVRFLTRTVGERDAEDLTQQILLRGTHGLSGFRGDASPRA